MSSLFEEIQITIDLAKAQSEQMFEEVIPW